MSVFFVAGNAVEPPHWLHKNSTNHGRNINLIVFVDKLALSKEQLKAHFFTKLMVPNLYIDFTISEALTLTIKPRKHQENKHRTDSTEESTPI